MSSELGSKHASQFLTIQSIVAYKTLTRCSVAVVSSVTVWASHLSTNRMCFYFFQSKWVVIVSSPGDFSTRSCRRLVYETGLERFPRWVFGEFYRSAKLMFESFLAQRICSYVGEPESLWEGWKHKPCAQIKSSKKDSNKKNDPVRRNAMIFELLR